MRSARFLIIGALKSRRAFAITRRSMLARIVQLKESSMVKAIFLPAVYAGVTPYLIVRDAARALDFYKKAFGATEVMRLPAPGGKVGHAEIKIGEGVVMLADESPEMGHKGPQSYGGTPIILRPGCGCCAVLPGARRGRHGKMPVRALQLKRPPAGHSKILQGTSGQWKPTPRGRGSGRNGPGE